MRLKIAGPDSHCSSWVRIRCIARFGAEVGQLHILIGLFLVILGQRLPCLGVRDESVAHAKSLQHHNIKIHASNHDSIPESTLSCVLSPAGSLPECAVDTEISGRKILTNLAGQASPCTVASCTPSSVL